MVDNLPFHALKLDLIELVGELGGDELKEVSRTLAEQVELLAFQSQDRAVLVLESQSAGGRGSDHGQAGFQEGPESFGIVPGIGASLGEEPVGLEGKSATSLGRQDHLCTKTLQDGDGCRPDLPLIAVRTASVEVRHDGSTAAPRCRWNFRSMGPHLAAQSGRTKTGQRRVCRDADDLF
jgi:hypothetical protein